MGPLMVTIHACAARHDLSSHRVLATLRRRSVPATLDNRGSAVADGGWTTHFVAKTGASRVKQPDAVDLSFVDTMTSESNLAVPADERVRRFVVVHGAPEQRVSLHAHPALIGRSPATGATIVLRHATVSRRHLQIGWDGRTHSATELGSHNGTFVGQRRLADGETVSLSHGDVLRCGDVVLVYESQTRDPSAPAAGEVRIPGVSTAAAALRAAIMRVAPDPASALIMGETGTGKEYVAREIHRLRGRAGEFVALNCAALSPQLVESQLFGHVKGAFTGATSAGEGLFRAAHGGTLFLDEIGELPLDLQPKLLRALQERRIRPVGGSRELAVDVRVLAATNRDLEQLVIGDQFRRDLFARLRMHELRVPALRERPADVLGWVGRFAAQWRVERNLPSHGTLTFTPDAAVAVVCGAWPDNLRGLDHLVHRYAHLDRKVTLIDVTALLPQVVAGLSHVSSEAVTVTSLVAPEAPEKPATPAPRRPSPSREALLAVLQETGSIRGAARHFDRDRRQIYRWVTAYGIDDSEFQAKG